MLSRPLSLELVVGFLPAALIGFPLLTSLAGRKLEPRIHIGAVKMPERRTKVVDCLLS